MIRKVRLQVRHDYMIRATALGLALTLTPTLILCEHPPLPTLGHGHGRVGCAWQGRLYMVRATAVMTSRAPCLYSVV